MKAKRVTVYHCPEGLGGGAGVHGAPGWYYDLADEDGIGDFGVGPYHTSIAARYAATVIAEKAENPRPVALRMTAPNGYSTILCHWRHDVAPNFVWGAAAQHTIRHRFDTMSCEPL